MPEIPQIPNEQEMGPTADTPVPQSAQNKQEKVQPINIPMPQMIDIEAIVRTITTGSNKALIQEIQKHRKNTPLVTLVLNRYTNYFLNPNLVRPLYEIVDSIGKKDAIDLYLLSTGGIAEVPWHIVSILRSYATRFGAIIPEHALSGATHIAIAADELVMLEISSLGSVDPSRTHALLPKDANGNPIQASVQDFKHMMKFVSSPLGRWFKRKSMREITIELFKYVNPLALGAIDRSNQLSRLITRKVLASRVERLSKKREKNIEEKLAGEYFSHSFPISRKEVESELRIPVVKPNADLKKAIWELNLYYDSLFKSQIVLPGTNQMLAARYLGFIDSENVRKIIFGIYEISGKVIAEIVV
jgi:hypothetical protein